MHTTRWISMVGLGVAASVGLAQTTGFTPINDLGSGHYEGFQGGLYPGGVNIPPPGHLQAVLAEAMHIRPLDGSGQPESQHGKIVMIALGMSNANQEFGPFERSLDAAPRRNGRLVVIDTAKGGQDAQILADPLAAYWSYLDDRLAAAGVTPQQVQVAWLKEAVASPTDPFPQHAQTLRDLEAQIMRNARARYPNLRLVYVSSRTFGGYATTPLNPEPFAYESGFATKWLIEDQINGDPGLNFGQLPGAVVAPAMVWGPYPWADGTNPRSDGLVWLRDDFEADGTHPSPTGEAKVASMLMGRIAVDPTTYPWAAPHVDVRPMVRDAIADTTIDARTPDMNFGDRPNLRVRGGDNPAVTLIKFDVSDIPRQRILAAKLSLRADDLASAGGTVRIVPDTGWSELGVTFNNAPAIGPAVATHPVASRGGTVGVDVTQIVRADPDGIVALAIDASGFGSAQTLQAWAREGGQPPRLVLTLEVPCPADLTGAIDPNDPGYGVPDGTLDANDFFFYLGLFAAGDPAADISGSANPQSAAFGASDGVIDAADFFTYLTLFAGGCP